VAEIYDLRGLNSKNLRDIFEALHQKQNLSEGVKLIQAAEWKVLIETPLKI
jgi:uncharacterized alkaline shock family protein YloU